MNNPVDKQLIFEHFADRETALQRRMIVEWLKQPEHKERYYEWLEEWENQNPQYAINVETPLQQTLHKLLAEPTPPHSPVDVQPPNRFWLTWRWAAVLAGLLLLGSLYAGRSYILHRSVQTSFGEVRQVTLPDGSRVTLMANSSLRYPRFRFGNRTRRVSVSGEANFAVKHLTNHQPFVVSTDHALDVVVLGTEFSVFSRPRGTTVVLQRGKVQVVQTTSRSPRRITLKPGDLVSLDSAGFWSMKHLARPDAYAPWREHRFAFDETTLGEIAQLLEENYGVRVRIADSTLIQRTVSGTFRTQTATELSQVIADLLDVKVRQTGNQITFTNAETP